MTYETELLEGNAIRINFLGSLYGASIEDESATMALVIDKLITERRVTSIILAESREYEYDTAQTKLLTEIADAIVEILREKKLVSIKKFGPGCERYVPVWFNWVQDLAANQLRSDPVGAYVSLLREIRHIRTRAASSEHEQEKQCHTTYLSKVLLPIQEILDRCQLIQLAKPYLTAHHIGDRRLYREIFHASIRPNFMYTKYMTVPPQGEAVDRYNIGDIQIQIFKVPGKTRYFYHVTPPEFRLTEDEYILLDGARRILEERRPRELEIKEQERIRDVFYNIGTELLRDLADQMGKTVSSTDIEKLANILTRYTAGLGIIEVLLADEKTQDIFINSPLGVVPVYIFHADYEECETNLIPTRVDGDRWATRFRLISGRPLDEANPVLDTETSAPGGRARITAINPRLSPDGLGFALRRHRDKPWTFPLFLDAGYFDPLFAGLMWFITDYGRSYLIAGTRGSGKTSMLGSCMLQILPRNRIISIEDTLELPVEQLRKLGYNIERLKSRSVITRVETELAADEALRTSLRLGDSCLIVGEVRSSIPGWEEVLVVENGTTKRVPIEELKNKSIEDYKIPTLDFDLKVGLKPLAGFVKHPERDKLLEVITKTGRRVTVTPDHSLFHATKDFKIAPIECKDLKKGDSIVIPASIPVGFNDIDSLDVLKILPEFRLENFESDTRKAIQILGWKKATEIAEIISGDIYNYFRTAPNQQINIPISSFQNLMQETGIEFNPTQLKVNRGTGNPIPAAIPVNEDFCRFLGYYVSEGYSRLSDREGGDVILTNSNEHILKDIKNLSKNLFNLEPIARKVYGKGESMQLRIGSVAFANLISILGCGRICTEKRVPPLIFGLSKLKIAAFLRGLYSGDGGFTASESSGNCIKYTSTSKKLAEDVAYLLLAFGIVATIRFKKARDPNYSDQWSVEFKDREMVAKFLKEIGFEQNKSNMMIKGWQHTSASMVSLPREELKKYLTKYPRRYRHLFRFERCSKRYLRQVVNDPVCEVSEQLKVFANGEFFLDEIKEIKEIKLEKAVPVYDLSIDPSQNFIGGFGGILLHNTEAKALYEAMRIGALANVVAGTIHGGSAYSIFDRVVNDLGVPTTSFKATDLVVICNRLRSADGLHTFRRVTEVTEVRKHWKNDPVEEGGFVNLMEYSAKQDTLKPTGTLLNGESFILNEIASNVREWSGNWAAVWENINLRGRILNTIVDVSRKTGDKNILEAETVVKTNEMFHLISERIKREVGVIDSERVYNDWLEWFKSSLK